MTKSIVQDDTSKCFLCGKNGASDPLEVHHIFGGPNRRLADEDGLIVHICGFRCHREGRSAAHKSFATAEYLRTVGQEAYERTHTREEFFRRYGRNYIGGQYEQSYFDGSPCT